MNNFIFIFTSTTVRDSFGGTWSNICIPRFGKPQIGQFPPIENLKKHS